MATMNGEPNYRSQLERRVCRNLQNRGVKYRYEPYQIKYVSYIQSAYCTDCHGMYVVKKHTYTPDVVLDNGIVIEIKGKFTAENRTKMLAIRNSNPHLDIRMLFQADNWLTRKKAAKYSDWCERNGFTYHVGEKVPESWLN